MHRADVCVCVQDQNGNVLTGDTLNNLFQLASGSNNAANGAQGGQLTQTHDSNQSAMQGGGNNQAPTVLYQRPDGAHSRCLHVLERSTCADCCYERL